MFKGLWSSICLERRRLLFVTSLAFLAGALFYLRSDLDIQGVHASVVIGAIYALVVGLAALLVCLFLPSLRFMVEAVAVSRLLFSFFVLAQPAIGYKILAMPTLNAAIVVSGGLIISRLLHGRIVREKTSGWRDRVLPRGAFNRQPVRLQGTLWQHRFVGWLDDTAPIPA